MRLTTLTMFAVLLAAVSLPASANVVLNDWCVNLNGDISVCNGGPASGGSSSVNLSAWDQTLSPASNTLGTITVNIGTGTQLVAVYMDYDVDFSLYGSFQDYGVTGGTIGATQSYELADPNVSNIFSDFAGDPGPLPDTNTVGTYAPPAPPCCDVSWALEESLTVDPALYSGGTVTFTVGTTAPTSGFYLQQTNGNPGGDTIYLSDSVSLTPVVSSGIPEPSSIVLFGVAALAASLLLRRRQRVHSA